MFKFIIIKIHLNNLLRKGLDFEKSLLFTVNSQNIHRLWEIMKKILIIFYYEGKSSTICIESTVIKDERNIVRKTTKNSR